MQPRISKQQKSELDRIAQSQGGVLKPADVVAAAKRATSPLHRLFEWDDKKAAKAYRVDQARQIIQIYVESIPGIGEARAYVALRDDAANGGGYRRTGDALADQVTRDALLRQFADDVAQVLRRYSYLRLVAPEQFAAIEQALSGKVSRAA